MTITVKFPNGEAMSFVFPEANDINKIVLALAANLDSRVWNVIEILIHKLGQNLTNE